MMGVLRKLLAGATLLATALSSFSQVEAAGGSLSSTHAHIIPIRHSVSNNAIVYIANGTYRPGAGVTSVRITASAAGGQGGGTNPGASGGASSFLAVSAPGGAGGATTGSAPNGQDGNGEKYGGWETSFPAGQRAGAGAGLAGVGPGAGGGAMGGTASGGVKGGLVVRQTVAVTPGTAYTVTVGKGGAGALNAGGKGADGFVLIEWN